MRAPPDTLDVRLAQQVALYNIRGLISQAVLIAEEALWVLRKATIRILDEATRSLRRRGYERPHGYWQPNGPQAMKRH